MARWLIALAVLLVSAFPDWVKASQPAKAVPSPADVLIFNNGDRLTGKLLRAVEGNVVFRSDMAGELTIPFSKVKELHSGSAFVALREGKPGRTKPVGTGVVTVESGNLLLAQPGKAAETIPAKQLAFLIDEQSYAREIEGHASFRRGWSGSATAGLTLVRSTETATTFTGAANFVRQIPTVAYLPKNHRTTLNLTETYGTNATPVIPQTTPPSPSTVVQTSIFHADGERDQYFNPRLFALTDVSFDHNFSQGLQLQQLYGIGFGWTPLQDGRQQIDVKADLHYEKQQFLNRGSNLDIVGSIFQENYRRTLPHKIALTQWANVLPAWNDLVAYSANAYVGLTMPVLRRVSVSLSATDNYLNNPSPGYRTNSVQFVTGVTYAIK